jgi:hypothetical protein
MFLRPRDPELETWNGRRLGVDGALGKLGADAAHPIGELEQRLPDLIANCDELHYSLGQHPTLDASIAGMLARLRRSEKRGKRPPRAIVDLRASLHELRLRKGPEEIALLERAAALTSDAHRAVMRQGRPGVGEHQLEATLAHTFRSGGGTGPGLHVDRRRRRQRDHPALHRKRPHDRRRRPGAGRRRLRGSRATPPTSRARSRPRAASPTSSAEPTRLSWRSSSRPSPPASRARRSRRSTSRPSAASPRR